MLWIALDKILKQVRKAFVPLLFLALCFLSIYFINNIYTLINQDTWVFEYPEVVPAYQLIGVDFRGAVFYPGKILLSSFNVYADPVKFVTLYPPLTIALALPFQLLSRFDAYTLQVVLLFISNLVCLILAAVLVNDYVFKKMGVDDAWTIATLLAVFLMMAFNLFAGYPFLFSFERGNNDIFAMILSLSSLWVLLKHPNKIWLPVILLSLAVHIKIYPAILFMVLFYKHRLKIVIPAGIINVLFLFVLGPANAFGFLQTILHFTNLSQFWIGDHSAYSFGGALVEYTPILQPYLPALRAFLTYFPVLVWGVVWFAIFQMKEQKYFEIFAIFGFIISIPVMEVFPSHSNDYKTVISASGTLILILLVLVKMYNQQRLRDYLQLFIIAVCLLFIGRGYNQIDKAQMFLINKYPWIFILELLMAINILSFKRMIEKNLANQHKESILPVVQN